MVATELVGHRKGGALTMMIRNDKEVEKYSSMGRKQLDAKRESFSPFDGGSQSKSLGYILKR
jgi:hypothetical protein